MVLISISKFNGRIRLFLYQKQMSRLSYSKAKAGSFTILIVLLLLVHSCRHRCSWYRCIPITNDMVNLTHLAIHPGRQRPWIIRTPSPSPSRVTRHTLRYGHVVRSHGTLSPTIGQSRDRTERSLFIIQVPTTAP